MKTWRDHLVLGESYTVLDEYDDGSAVCLLSYSGGFATGEAWSQLKLMKIDADGRKAVRQYMALSADWKPV